jgi:large subunit ribosomal protein L35
MKMPKMKTHKGAKKRFVVSATGKVKHKHAGTGHLAWRKTTKQRRQLRGSSVISSADAKRIVLALNPGK